MNKTMTEQRQPHHDLSDEFSMCECTVCVALMNMWVIDLTIVGCRSVQLILVLPKTHIIDWFVDFIRHTGSHDLHQNRISNNFFFFFVRFFSFPIIYRRTVNQVASSRFFRFSLRRHQFDVLHNRFVRQSDRWNCFRWNTLTGCGRCSLKIECLGVEMSSADKINVKSLLGMERIVFCEQIVRVGVAIAVSTSNLAISPLRMSKTVGNVDQMIYHA